MGRKGLWKRASSLCSGIAMELLSSTQATLRAQCQISPTGSCNKGLYTIYITE